MENTDLTTTTTATILNAWHVESRLSAEYNALEALIADDKKKISTARKSNKLAAIEAIKTVNSAVDSTLICNKLLPRQPRNADAAVRKANQRRRDWLKLVLSGAYPSYDFTTDGSRIVCDHVGDAFVREARGIMQVIETIKRLDLDLHATEVELAESLRRESNDASIGKQVVTDATGVTAEKFAAIAARLGYNLTPVENENKTEKVA